MEMTYGLEEREYTTTYLLFVKFNNHSKNPSHYLSRISTIVVGCIINTR
jgi:hypothetical protein